jgi:hypothetical protein
MVGVITAVLAVCATVSVILVLGSDPARRARGESAGSPGSSGSPAATASSAGARPATPAAPSARALSVLPPPCGTARRATVNRLVPKAKVEQAANTTLATCTYSSAGTTSRWLRIENRIFDPIGGDNAAQTASGFFGAQWTRVREDPTVRIVSLKRQDGLGDEAYRAYKLDNGQPTVVGEVGIRWRNAVITVSYSGVAPNPADDAANERKYLTEATGVAREVLGALQ